MDCKKIIDALRCSASVDRECSRELCPFFVQEEIPEELQEKCGGVDKWESCDVDGIALAAADAMERLIKERDMARAERDAVQKAYIAAVGGAN